ncbi:MAG: type IV pilus inner membrane component PilO [Planctomycetota bacterium]|jgi:Tfp pilus assembly protein PilO
MSQSDPHHKLKILGWWLHGLGLTATLTILVCAELLVLRPIDRRAEASAERSGQLQAFLRDEDRMRAEHAQLADDLDHARRQAADLKRRIPDEPQEADFLAQISELADEVGLEILEYRPGMVVTEDSYSAMTVDLDCQGRYAGLCRFVNRLADLPRCSTVTRLEIESGEQADEYSVSMSLELYFSATGQGQSKEKG